MTLQVDNPNVDRLLDEITQITGESRTEAIRKALEERRYRLSDKARATPNEARLLAFLQDEVWPLIPSDHLGVRLSKEAEEAVLGYGENGV